MTTPVPLLEIRNLSKTFPGLRALDNVSFSVKSGEIVGLIGRNGSGKSTLVKVLSGIHRPDPGSQIMLGSIDSAAGGTPQLHFLHQELGLISTLTTVENLDLDRRLGKTRLFPVAKKRERARARELIGRFGVEFDVAVPVGTLTAAERAIVAIARALGQWTHPENVLILDEPTAALEGDEVKKLFRAVRRAASTGAGVIFISHRLDEVIDLADRVVALRDGQVVADIATVDCDYAKLVQLVVGSDSSAEQQQDPHAIGQALLSVRGLRGSGPGRSRVQDVSFDVGAGEIVGVAGLLGSGRDELLGLIFGARAGSASEIIIGSELMKRPNVRAALAAGAGYVSADRARDGAIMSFSARENLTLPLLKPLRRRFGRLDTVAERRDSQKWLEMVGLRPLEPERRLSLFSGGNQQKVALTRWLRTGAKVLILDEPTQGVDIQGKAAIYELLMSAARDGAAIVFSSSDPQELAAISDRVLVMRDGMITTSLEGESLTEARIVEDSHGFTRQSQQLDQSGEER
jgi:ribose transport system ATP-binding protein